MPLSVVVEIEWVLRSVYEQSEKAMLELFSRLLESRELEFQEEASIEIALSLYADNNTDFADCLDVAATFAHERTPLFTLDQKASRITHAELLFSTVNSMGATDRIGHNRELQKVRANVSLSRLACTVASGLSY